MPSLRKRVSSYFRQLSFHNEPRGGRHNVNENSFVTKYLQGAVTLREGPAIIHGKTPTDLPNYELGPYAAGAGSITGCYTGPKGGLTTVPRTEKHLSVPDTDIDFIDTPQDEHVVPTMSPHEIKKSPLRPQPGQPLDNATMVIKVAGQEYCVTNRTKRHSKSHSLGSLGDFHLEIETTKIDREFYDLAVAPLPNTTPLIGDGGGGDGPAVTPTNNSFAPLAKSTSEGDPFRHKKRGKIIKVAQRADVSRGAEQAAVIGSAASDDSALPDQWNRKSELIYGISDSLYDRNQVTQNKNGDPIADCFAILALRDCAIMAVADGVNWGEKASVAARSALHGCLHYLATTIFSDATPFDALTTQAPPSAMTTPQITNTREIFVCLLRSFSCAHDLILENKGMLTTLTVAVVLPLKRTQATSQQRYVACVCNVGDTLAYVYSQRHGMRELTKGSHDINCNRDMRDALGALGPVDGINPELSNLTLSVTMLSKGDIVMVASDGLTDNFDPNVCRFTVNGEPPVKPPRRSAPVAENKASSLRRQASNRAPLHRAKTTLEAPPRSGGPSLKTIARNPDGIPYVTPLQRYELQLLLMEDILKNGITGRDAPCTTAKKLCENLTSFTLSITSAKRRTLEDHDLYFDCTNGVMVEVSQHEKKIRRKKGLEKVQNLPGKLDHVTVVAWNVGNFEARA